MAIKRTWLRWLTSVLCMVVPLLVSYARLYRGMHHVTDVVVGMANGIVCALLAYGWYRHRQHEEAPEQVGGTEPTPAVAA